MSTGWTCEFFESTVLSLQFDIPYDFTHTESKQYQRLEELLWTVQINFSLCYQVLYTMVYKGLQAIKRNKWLDRVETVSDFPLYFYIVSGCADWWNQAVRGFSFVLKVIYFQAPRCLNSNSIYWDDNISTDRPAIVLDSTFRRLSKASIFLWA